MNTDPQTKTGDALATLYAIFGDTSVFLAIPKGSKAPPELEWQKTSFADTQKEDYQGRLEQCVRVGGNIGVILGPASDLYSIDLDGDDLISDFLALNPCLEKTTRTKGKRGNQFFLPAGARVIVP